MISRHPGVFLMSVGIGFACVKHCARGFTAAISHDEQALSRDKAAITTAR